MTYSNKASISVKPGHTGSGFITAKNTPAQFTDSVSGKLFILESHMILTETPVNGIKLSEFASQRLRDARTTRYLVG